MRSYADAVPRRHVRAGALIALLLLGGCATLPSNGPTAGQIVDAQKNPGDRLPFDIVDITPAVAATPAAMAPADTSRLAALAADGRVDQIGIGDVLGVQIYEVGTGLFTANGTDLSGAVGGEGGAPTPAASGSTLRSGLVVDQSGAITLPYVGRVVVAGLTTAEAQARIQSGLRGMSQSPQVIVSIRDNLSNSVIIMGAVGRPGRVPLTLARERLLDAIATSGGIQTGIVGGNSTGTTTGPQDMVIRFTRHGRTAEQLLETIESGAPDDLVLLPGDHIDIVRQPRTFIVFGATDRISQLPFESRRLSLAEALARVGGPADSRADPRAVFLFRYTVPDGAPNLSAPVPAGTNASQALAAATLPMVYRLDMLQAQSYFLAQRFQMRDKDVIYIANARSNQAQKLSAIIGQLFSPVFAVRGAVR